MKFIAPFRIFIPYSTLTRLLLQRSAAQRYWPSLLGADVLMLPTFDLILTCCQEWANYILFCFSTLVFLRIMWGEGRSKRSAWNENLKTQSSDLWRRSELERLVLLWSFLCVFTYNSPWKNPFFKIIFGKVLAVSSFWFEGIIEAGGKKNKKTHLLSSEAETCSSESRLQESRHILSM